MRIQRKHRFFPLALFTACLFALAACSSSLPSSDPTVAPSTVAVAQNPTAPSITATPLPPTPTASPPLAVLLAPPGSDQALAGALQPVLEELSAQAGLHLEVRPSLSTSDLVENLRLVVALPPDPGLASLASAAPATQFLALGFNGLQPAGNLSVAGAQADRPDQQGFLAGYMAAVITKDARVGVISLADTSAGQAARQGFINGVIYYCGLCRPANPPFFQYPISAELPAEASQDEQQAAGDALIDQAVETVYVFPGAGDERLLEYLAEAGVKLIGGITPPASVQSQWVASVQADGLAAVREVWPDLLNGKGGASLELPLAITDVNAENFSPGRQLLVEETQANLVEGFIDTGAAP